MKKRKYIIFVIIIVVLALAAAFLYIDFSNQKDANEVGDIDYATQYENEENVKERIEPITGENISLQFFEVDKDQSLSKKVEEIELLLNYEPGQKLTMSQIEKVAGGKLDSLFDDCSLRMIGSVKTNLKHIGYCVKTQRKNGMAPKIVLAVTPDAISDKAWKALPFASASNLDRVKVMIVYNHSKRNIKENGQERQASQYCYESIFELDGMSYYVQMEYTGFDIKLNVVDTTKEETSKEFAEFLRNLIGILRKDS